VLASHRSQSLAASLQSLRAAAYGGDRVELEVLLVRPLGASAEWPAAVSVAEGIAWPHGQKTVTILAGSSDESGPWLQDPGLEDDGHLLLVLEPDVVVAPWYYRRLMGLVRAYYTNITSFDPRLYGVALRGPTDVVDDRSGRRRPPRKVADLLSPSVDVYLNPHFGLQGQLLFPRPWARFRRWLAANPANGTSPSADPFPPCVSASAALRDTPLRDHSPSWATHFRNWVFREGLYNLHPNSNGAMATSVSGSSDGDPRPLVDPPEGTALPPRSRLPLYDQYFEPVGNPETLRLRAKLYAKLPAEYCTPPVFRTRQAPTRRAL